MTIVRRLESSTAVFEMGDDGILRITFKRDSVIDTEKQDENITPFSEITEGKKFPVIYKTEAGVIFTKEARERAPKLEKKYPVTASALVTNNLAYKLIAHFYINFNKPSVPTKSFTNEEEAVKWLKRFL